MLLRPIGGKRNITKRKGNINISFRHCFLMTKYLTWNGCHIFSDLFWSRKRSEWRKTVSRRLFFMSAIMFAFSSTWFRHVLWQPVSHLVICTCHSVAPVAWLCKIKHGLRTTGKRWMSTKIPSENKVTLHGRCARASDRIWQGPIWSFIYQFK